MKDFKIALLLYIGLIVAFTSCNDTNRKINEKWVSNEGDFIYIYSKKILINYSLFNYFKKDSLIYIYSNFICKDTSKIKISINGGNMVLEGEKLYLFGFDTNRIDFRADNDFDFDPSLLNNEKNKKINIIGNWILKDSSLYYNFKQDYTFSSYGLDNGKYCLNGNLLDLGTYNICYKFTTYKIINFDKNTLILQDAFNNIFEFKKSKY